MEADNTVTPNPASLADYKEAEVAAFLEDVLPIYKALGLVAFEPGPEQIAPTGVKADGGAEPGAGPTEGIPLFLSASGASGEARSTREGFVVLAGSSIRKDETATIPKNGKRKRQQLLDEGELEDPNPGGQTWTLRSNQRFSSPSEAAYVLTGSSVSGPSYWKTAGGKSLGELELAEADAVEEASGAHEVEGSDQAPGADDGEMPVGDLERENEPNG